MSGAASKWWGVIHFRAQRHSSIWVEVEGLMQAAEQPGEQRGPTPTLVRVCARKQAGEQAVAPVT